MVGAARREEDHPARIAAQAAHRGLDRVDVVGGRSRRRVDHRDADPLVALGGHVLDVLLEEVQAGRRRVLRRRLADVDLVCEADERDVVESLERGQPRGVGARVHLDAVDLGRLRVLQERDLERAVERRRDDLLLVVPAREQPERVVERVDLVRLVLVAGPGGRRADDGDDAGGALSDRLEAGRVDPDLHERICSCDWVRHVSDLLRGRLGRVGG